MNRLQILVLLSPDAMREDIIDTLMSLSFISGFTLTSAMGFSAEHSQFNVREQVEGCRAFTRFEVVCEAGLLGSLLEAVSSAAGSEPLRYWVVDAPQCGHLPVAIAGEAERQ
jgi:hypothetical protein